MRYILWGWGKWWDCFMIQSITEFSQDYKSPSGNKLFDKQIIAITSQLSLVLKKEKISLCRLFGCSAAAANALLWHPAMQRSLICSGAFLWTVCLAVQEQASWVIMYFFELRSRVLCELEAAEMLWFYLLLWKCKTCHYKSESLSLKSIFCLLMNTGHGEQPGEKRWLIDSLTCFVVLFAQHT